LAPPSPTLFPYTTLFRSLASQIIIMARAHQIIALGGLLILFGSSCVSKKKYVAIQASNETLHGKLDECNRSLSACMGDKSVMERSEEHTSELQSRENLVC